SCVGDVKSGSVKSGGGSDRSGEGSSLSPSARPLRILRTGWFAAAVALAGCVAAGALMSVSALAAPKVGIAPAWVADRGERGKMLREDNLGDAKAQKMFDTFVEKLLDQFIDPQPPFSIESLPKTRGVLAQLYTSGKKGKARDRLNDHVFSRMSKALDADNGQF